MNYHMVNTATLSTSETAQNNRTSVDKINER